MNDDFWDIFNRNMRSGVHHTTGDTRRRDVAHLIYWLYTHDKWVKRGHVLNVGIGDSQEAKCFKEHEWLVSGITNSQDEVDYAKQFGILAETMDMHQLTFDDNHFDLVYGHDTIEHSISPVMMFTQFRRVLKPGGILAFHYPTKDDAYNWTHWFMEDPKGIVVWLYKFGFRLLYWGYTPGDTCDHLYIAEKSDFTSKELERGANVIDDMLAGLKQLEGRNEIT